MATTEYLLGKREQLGWVIETSYASGGTMSSGEVIGRDCSFDSPDFDEGFTDVYTAGADSREISDRIVNTQSYPFTLTFKPVNWKFLKYIFNVADGTDGDTKTHTFTLANTINTFKLERARRHTTNFVSTFIGGFAKSCTINFAKSAGGAREGFVGVSMPCVAKSYTNGTSVTTLSAITKSPFRFANILLTLNGSSIVEVNSGSITFDNGINEEDSRYCNTTADGTLSDPIPTIFRMTGSFNINLKDNSIDTLRAAREYVSGATTLLFDRDGTGNDQLLVTFTKFTILKAPDPTNLEGVTTVEISWAANITSIVARDDISTY